MRRATVVRRFEVQALDRAELKDIAARLREAGRDLPPPGVQVLEPEHFPMMRIRVTGPSDVVAKIRNLVRRSETVTVHRDWMDVLTDPIAPSPRDAAAPDGAGAGRLEYPDRRALLRIDPEARSRDVKGSGADIVVAIVD
jgi:hypothetical protein